MKSEIAGAVLILVGLVILVLLAGFIFSVILLLIQLIAVLIGIILVLGGIALIVGRKWWRKGPWDWDSKPSTTT